MILVKEKSENTFGSPINEMPIDKRRFIPPERFFERVCRSLTNPIRWRMVSIDSRIIFGSI